jgi:acetyltransferase-like isoleucine patch superfamily enzyme
VRVANIAVDGEFGKNSFKACLLSNSSLPFVGGNCIIRRDAVTYVQAAKGHRNITLTRLRIGHRATITAHAIVTSSVDIGDGAIVSAGAVVMKESQIGKCESWRGVRALCLRALEELP